MSKEKLQKIALGIIRDTSGNVLIVRRAKEENGTGNVKLSWVFPGGKMEVGETIDETVVREVKEETGYLVEVDHVVSERRHPQFPVYVYYFACILTGTKNKSIPSDNEIKEIKFVNPADVGEYFTTNLDPNVNDYINK